jgi:hypothetical protein
MSMVEAGYCHGVSGSRMPSIIKKEVSGNVVFMSLRVVNTIINKPYDIVANLRHFCFQRPSVVIKGPCDTQRHSACAPFHQQPHGEENCLRPMTNGININK